MTDATTSYEIDDGLVTWDIRDLARAEPEDVQAFLESAMEVSQRPGVEAAVIRLPDEGTIAGDVFELVEEYGAFFERQDIERVALVSGDVKNLALKSKLRLDGFEVEAIDAYDDAVTWARGDD